MYLFFDTETTGLPRTYRASIKDLENWPRVVQIAWLTYSKSGQLLSENDYIVKPEGFIIHYPERSDENSWYYNQEGTCRWT